jgi:hypothetical protein
MPQIRISSDGQKKIENTKEEIKQLQQKTNNDFNKAYKEYEKGDIKGAMKQIQDIALWYISGNNSFGLKIQQVQEDDVSTMEELRKMQPLSTANENFMLYDNNNTLKGLICLQKGMENPIFKFTVEIGLPTSPLYVFETYVFKGSFDAEQYQKEILSFEAIPPKMDS